MPDLCGNCAMNVPRMGICGRKLILVFFPPSCSSLWFFLLWEYRRRWGEDPGSVVGGRRSLTWQLLLLVQHLCLALLGLRSTMSSHITILCLVSGPHDQALSLISARYSLPYHFYRWWTNCFSPVGDSPPNLAQLLSKAHDLQGQSQREIDGCSLSRLPLISKTSGLISFSQLLDDIIWL